MISNKKLSHMPAHLDTLLSYQKNQLDVSRNVFAGLLYPTKWHNCDRSRGNLCLIFSGHVWLDYVWLSSSITKISDLIYLEKYFQGCSTPTGGQRTSQDQDQSQSCLVPMIGLVAWLLKYSYYKCLEILANWSKLDPFRLFFIVLLPF